MKRIVMIMCTLCLYVSFIVIGMNPVTVKADEVGTYSDLKIKATVPEEFTKDVVVVFIQTATDFKFQVVLNAKNNYQATLTVLNNMDYAASATTNEAKYKIQDLQEVYSINETMVEINFSIKEGLTQIGNQEVTTAAIKVADLNAKEMYEQYITEVSFIEKNNDYESFLSIYDNGIMKKYFLGADSTNTEELWNQMTKYEKFNYYMLYVRPKTLITGVNAVNSVSELKEGLSSERQLLSNISGGSKVINAIETAWIWEWNRYQEKGEFTNIFAVDSINSVSKHIEKESDSISDVDVEEKESVKNDTVGKRFLNGLKKNILTFIILGAVLVVGLVMVLKGRE